MRRLLALPVAVAVALAASACSKSLNTGNAESFIRTELAAQGETDVASVDCPDREAKSGDTFTCTAHGRDGTTLAVTVTQTSDDGRITFRAPVLHIRSAQDEIARQVSARTGADDVTVDCPDLVTAEAGGTFACAGAAGGRTFTVNATMTNASGAFTFQTAE